MSQVDLADGYNFSSEISAFSFQKIKFGFSGIILIGGGCNFSFLMQTVNFKSVNRTQLKFHQARSRLSVAIALLRLISRYFKLVELAVTTFSVSDSLGSQYYSPASVINKMRRTA
jgi:hypothetical protein